MPITILQNDITKIPCDVMVDPTDRDYSGSGGVDRAMHTAAGPQLDALCQTLPPLAVGAVHATPAFALPCQYIIHTVGPRWRGGGHNEPVLLRSCYLNALLQAVKLDAHSIAFPLIASGTFGFPRDQVLRLAMQAVSDFLSSSDRDLEVFLCVYDRNSYSIRQEAELKQYLSSVRPPRGAARAKNAMRPAPQVNEALYSCASMPMADALPAPPVNTPAADLDGWIKQQDDTFAVTLLKLIDQKGMTEVECYKKANVSRKTFYKINNSANYRPSKQTVIAFAIALELTLTETEQLLKTVGFSLSHSSTFDLIIEFFITNGRYDVFEINEALYQYDQDCLG